jgi:hypothetical protein
MGKAMMPSYKQNELFLMKLWPKSLPVTGQSTYCSLRISEMLIFHQKGRYMCEVMFFMLCL